MQHDTVIFDFGGVVTSSPFEAFNRLERARGLPKDFIRKVNALSPDDNAWARFERAEIDSAGFDAAFAESVGARPAPVGLALIVMVAVVAVMAFDAVGAIIVIAMFICPAGAARLMTDRLVPQLLWSVTFAVLAAVLGYVLAAWGPLWIGMRSSASAAGMIASVSGMILGLACLFGPKRRGIRMAATSQAPISAPITLVR